MAVAISAVEPARVAYATRIRLLMVLSFAKVRSTTAASGARVATYPPPMQTTVVAARPIPATLRKRRLLEVLVISFSISVARRQA